MPDPVHAWAAVAPDGTFYAALIDAYRLYGTKIAAQEVAGRNWASENTFYGEDIHAWPDAKRAGWRVVRVKIEVVEAA